MSAPQTFRDWLTPSALDLEHWRWHGMKPQRGGWDQPLWVLLQKRWARR